MIVTHQIDPLLCDYIIKEGLSLPIKQSIGERPDGKSSRKSKNAFFQLESIVSGMMWHWAKVMNAELMNYRLGGLETVQFTVYEKDDHYGWHIDFSKESMMHYGKPRQISLVLLLNDDFEGGNFVMEDKQISMTKGTLICFDSKRKHMVEPVQSGVRYSAVSWIL